MERIKISEGVHLNVINTDKFKTNLVSVNLIAPLRRETAAKNSLLVNVLKRGCETYPTLRDINKRLDDLYASSVGMNVSKNGDFQILNFSASMLDNSFTLDASDLFAENLKLLSELIFKPRTENGIFLEKYVESEKKQLCDRIAEQINNKTVYALNRCIELMCADEGFGVPSNGTIEDVQAITSEELFKHYRTAIASLPVEIFFIGNMDTAKIAEYVNKYLTFTPRNDCSYEMVIRREASSKPEVVEPMPVMQGKLTLGFRTGTALKDPDFPAFALFNELFGGSASSLLFKNVREKMSLCYYCSSVPAAPKGVMLVASGIENENKEKAENAILDQLRTIQNNAFEDEELELCRKSLINAYKEITDSSFGMYNWYLTRLLCGISSSPEDAAKSITAVVREQVVAISKKVAHEMTYFLKGTLKNDNSSQE